MVTMWRSGWTRNLLFQRYIYCMLTMLNRYKFGRIGTWISVHLKLRTKLRHRGPQKEHWDQNLKRNLRRKRVSGCWVVCRRQRHRPEVGGGGGEEFIADIAFGFKDEAPRELCLRMDSNRNTEWESCSISHSSQFALFEWRTLPNCNYSLRWVMVVVRREREAINSPPNLFLFSARE